MDSEVTVTDGDSSRMTKLEMWETHYKSLLRKFLSSYRKEVEDASAVDVDRVSRHLPYYEQVALDITQYGITTLHINLQDIYEWEEGIDLANFIQSNFLALWDVIDSEVDSFVRATLKEKIQNRSQMTLLGTLANNSETGQAAPQASEGNVIDLIQEMSAYDKVKSSSAFMSSLASIAIRDLRCEAVGELLNLRGTATRVSDVRPELKGATFSCSMCNVAIDHVEQQFKLTEPRICPNPECKNRNFWVLHTESCEFRDWQKVRLQENSTEIPAGSMPRSIDVIFKQGLCDHCKPGDRVIISGCLAAVPDVTALMKPGEVPKGIVNDRNRQNRSEFAFTDNAITGLRKLGVRDLGYRLLFFASDIQVVNDADDVPMKNLRNSAADDDAIAAVEENSMNGWRASQPIQLIFDALGISPQTQGLFREIAASSDTLDKLAQCFAPEIFGYENIKKGILMMLVGGVEKTTSKEGLKLRGDINMCIVGDPGTAKSQMLKAVRQFASRAVYAAGNTATAAGLTVSIHKDPDQGDAVIEAGALMLADKGICCIDEFEKMNNKDMVAIHEAMEQQTISICKSGIQATLNARASILAACNPRGGRYDPSKSFRHNVKLSAPIISRFDLFFTMMDHTDHDAIIASHIIRLHTSPSDSLFLTPGVLSHDLLKLYLTSARSRRPLILPEAREVLVDTYVAMRSESNNFHGTRSARVTVRQLESLVRLSEAVAKLKLTDYVTASHVREAAKIMQNSMGRLSRGQVTLDEEDDLLQPDENIPPASGDDHNTESTHIQGNGVVRPHDENARSVMTIDAEEFERIAATLIDRIRNIEFEMISKEAHDPSSTSISPIEAVVAKDDLIAWYIESSCDSVVQSSEEALEKEYKKVQRVINRMVNRDFTLIEELRDMSVPINAENDECEVQRMVTLRLHPNFASDHINYGVGEAGHANLPTSFFTSSNPEEQRDSNEDSTNVNVASWAIDDQDFMSYMYGWAPDTS